MSSSALFVDDSDSRIVYSPGWDVTPVNPLCDPVAGTEHCTAVPGSYAEFQFFGTAVSAAFNIPKKTGQASFQIDDGPKTLRAYNSACEGDGPALWESGPLAPGFHRLVMTNMGADASLKLDHINYEPLSHPYQTSYLVAGCIAGLTLSLLLITLLVHRRIKKHFRVKELEEACFPDYMYPCKGYKRSSFSFASEPHIAPSHAAPPPAYIYPKDGPTDNIFASIISTSSPHHGMKYTFTRAPFPNSLETQLPLRQPPPIHSGWKI